MRAMAISAFTALLALSTPAMAARQHTTGAVRTVDQQSRTVTLDDGTVYSVPADYKIERLTTGEQVRITWDSNGRIRIASHLHILK